jgi:hypothetical protein
MSTSVSHRLPAPRTQPQPLPLYVDDVSQFAKTLRGLLTIAAATPTHVQLLNMLTKAAGRGNYQRFRAQAPDAASLIATKMVATKQARAASDASNDLSTHAAKALTQFDAEGRLTRWPNRFAVQRIALWALWIEFAMHRRYTEREVNALLNAWHDFGDPATLRRELVEMKMLARTSDCREYWKLPLRPDDDIKAFLHALRALRESRGSGGSRGKRT